MDKQDKNDNEAMSKKVRVWLLENGKVRLHSRDEADELADTVTACVLHFAAKSQPVDENGLKACPFCGGKAYSSKTVNGTTKSPVKSFSASGTRPVKNAAISDGE